MAEGLCNQRSKGVEQGPQTLMIPASEERLKLKWLIGARCWASVGLLTAFLVGRYSIGLTLDLAPFVALITLLGASNLITYLLARQASAGLLIGIILADILLFTSLLYFYGGSTNPLSSIYFLYVILATIILPPLWGWLTATFSSICFAFLFFFFVPVPELSGHHAHHHDGFSTHLQGMLITFVFTAFLIVYFISRLTAALKERGLALAALKERGEHNERLAALTTLAAGAAHELRNPLAAISIAIGELEREIQGADTLREIEPEVQSIKKGVARCQGIINELCSNAGVISGEPLVATTVRTILEQVMQHIPDRSMCSVNLLDGAGDASFMTFVSSLAQALLSLIRNGLAYGPVQVSVALSEQEVCFSVRDSGPGIPQELIPRLGEPFFTTKPSGEGMGLGLFVTKTFADRLGGSLTFDTKLNKGTVAILSIPCVP
jgi:two-component system sensor histidine kinase RegB